MVTFLHFKHCYAFVLFCIEEHHLRGRGFVRRAKRRTEMTGREMGPNFWKEAMKFKTRVGSRISSSSPDDPMADHVNRYKLRCRILASNAAVMR